MSPKKKAKKLGKGSRAKHRPQRAAAPPPTKTPAILGSALVKQDIKKLKQEDKLLLDKEALQKDDKSFMILAKRLKSLMVRKKRL